MDVTTTASEETGAGTGPQTSGRGGNGGGGGGDSASSKARVPLRATNLTPAMQLVEDARLGAATWAEDGNTGLVAAVQRYYVRWQIASLRSVYSKASLSQVRRLTRSGETGLPLQSDEELVAVVQEMIDEGMLRGKVVMPGEGESESANRPPPHIVFFPSEDDATLRDEKLMARELRRVAERVSETERHVRAARERLTATKEFARYVLSGGRIPGGLGGDGGGGDGKDGGGGPPSLSRAGSSSLVWGVGRGGASGILGGDITAGTSGDIFRRFGFSPQFGVAGSNLSSIFAGESSLMYEESDLGAEDEDLMAGLTSD